MISSKQDTILFLNKMAQLSSDMHQDNLFALENTASYDLIVDDLNKHSSDRLRYMAIAIEAVEDAEDFDA